MWMTVRLRAIAGRRGVVRLCGRPSAAAAGTTCRSSQL
jgi:hypothetical protein